LVLGDFWFLTEYFQKKKGRVGVGGGRVHREFFGGGGGGFWGGGGGGGGGGVWFFGTFGRKSKRS